LSIKQISGGPYLGNANGWTGAMDLDKRLRHRMGSQLGWISDLAGGTQRIFAIWRTAADPGNNRDTATYDFLIPDNRQDWDGHARPDR